MWHPQGLWSLYQMVSPLPKTRRGTEIIILIPYGRVSVFSYERNINQQQLTIIILFMYLLSGACDDTCNFACWLEA
jgi:hypothetical protein